jgi:hypothetical protein
MDKMFLGEMSIVLIVYWAKYPWVKMSMGQLYMEEVYEARCPSGDMSRASSHKPSCDGASCPASVWSAPPPRLS